MKNLLSILVMLTITQVAIAAPKEIDSVYMWTGKGYVQSIKQNGNLLDGAINIDDSIQVWLDYNPEDLSAMHIDASIGGYDFFSYDGDMITNGDTVSFKSNGNSPFSDASYAFLTLTFTGSLLDGGLPTAEMLAQADNINFGVSQGNIDSYSIIGNGLDSNIPAVPIPAAAWLFMSGLLGLVAVSRRTA